jgi:hypothetical protein
VPIPHPSEKDHDTSPLGCLLVSGRIKDMDRWLGDGGMELIGAVGASFDAYGVNFAINASLAGRDRTKATLELKTETMRPAIVGTTYRLRGEVVRLARQVAYGEATVRDGDDQMISRATGTFLLHRDESSRATPPG